MVLDLIDRRLQLSTFQMNLIVSMWFCSWFHPPNCHTIKHIKLSYSTNVKCYLPNNNADSFVIGFTNIQTIGWTFSLEVWWNFRYGVKCCHWSKFIWLCIHRGVQTFDASPFFIIVSSPRVRRGKSVNLKLL